MTGGHSFNEVFLDDVEVSDDLRIAGVGEGWLVANTTLGYERTISSQSAGGSVERLLQRAQALGRTDASHTRERFARLLTATRINDWIRARSDQTEGLTPAASSLSKLGWSRELTGIGEVAGELLGPRFTADSGEWGTCAWTAHFLGAPANRIAGGSDEIQRNIIGRRLPGLPREPRSH